MNVRLIFAIISTLLEEIALVVIVLSLLPQFGIELPLPVLIVLIVALATYAVISYRLVSRALKKKVIIELPVKIGSRGKVVRRLAPEGMVQIKSELWVAKAVHGDVEKGEEVAVLEYDGLKLIVNKSDAVEQENIE